MHIDFLEDFMLFVIKGFLPMRAIESIWFKLWTLNVFVEKVMLALVKETLTKYVHLVLFTCFPITCTFKSWMSKGAHYVVVVIMNFLLGN